MLGAAGSEDFLVASTSGSGSWTGLGSGGGCGGSGRGTGGGRRAVASAAARPTMAWRRLSASIFSMKILSYRAT